MARVACTGAWGRHAPERCRPAKPVRAKRIADRSRETTRLDGRVITFPVVGGIFGIGRLATRLTAPADAEQIGPWHIGQSIDFKHAAMHTSLAIRDARGAGAAETSERRRKCGIGVETVAIRVEKRTSICARNCVQRSMSVFLPHRL
jgi:hypothetical protein